MSRQDYLIIFLIFGTCFVWQHNAFAEVALLNVNTSEVAGRRIPLTLFGIFFEEINHAGAGGLWTEFVNNRGFEAGGENTPSNIDPWTIIGNEKSVNISTDLSSKFQRNKVALRMDVLCDDHQGDNQCPAEGVGISNPGYWGMNIEQGKSYKVVFYVRSMSGSINVSVSLTGPNGVPTLASSNVVASDSSVSNWTKMELVLDATGTNSNSSLRLTTRAKDTIWLDQVSLMPLDTYKGHGCRIDLMEMLIKLKPQFLRFPGGCFVEGEWLRNAFRWKDTVGPWEERPGHFDDVWKYWTDDGIGYLEYLQLAEDLGALPVWVFNNGISHNDEVNTSAIMPFVQEALDGIEFARGSASSTWGSLRAALGHPQPFDLRYVAIGNEDCGKPNYVGNYLKFYDAIRRAYPDIKIISNCDASAQPLDHPADIYDYHKYTNANDMASLTHYFDNASRTGPKAFVSEYAVWQDDARNGTLLASLAESAFLMGLERNSDVVEMASYAPLFVNTNNREWMPDAIVFNSSFAYGTPSYWIQTLFENSCGATLLSSTLISENHNNSIVATAILWENAADGKKYIRVKAVNREHSPVDFKINLTNIDANSIKLAGSSKWVMTSGDVMDENSFTEPNKIVPVQSSLDKVGTNMDVVLSPISFTTFDLFIGQST